MIDNSRFSGMKGFTLVWLGQVVSLLGSGMTTFAISIWAWQITGQATALALAGFFGFGPTVLLSPIAGAIVDRSNRKTVMMLSDLAAGLSTVVLLILYASGMLQIWHIYVINAFAGVFAAFQFPAYSAAVTTMIRREQYARASGMLSLAHSASGVFAPLVAGALIGLVGIAGIMVIDILTFMLAIAALLVVHIPQPEATAEGEKGHGSLWKESGYGFRYIYERPSLLGLQMVFFFLNFSAMFGIILTTPMILARTDNNELLLGSVLSMGSIGGILGGLLLSAWGGPAKKVHGVLLGMALASIPAVLMGTGQSLPVWAVASFATSFFIPIINGSNQAIWQAKVAPDVQGRVFAVRRLIAQITAPVAMLMAGPLADYFFEPALSAGGGLAASLGWLTGTGPGAGMGLMYILSGVTSFAIGMGGYLFPAIRNVEDILPDHESISEKRSPTREERLRDLLEKRSTLLMQPPSPERESSLKDVSSMLRSLGSEDR